MQFHWEKDHTHAVFAWRWQPETQAHTLGFEMGMRDLDQDPRAVTCLWIATTSSTMRKINEDFDALKNDLVSLLPGDVRDKTNPACVVLVARIVKPLCFGQTTGDGIPPLRGSLTCSVILNVLL